MGPPNHITPPNWPLRLMRWIIKERYLEEIEGDMAEVFEDDLTEYSVSRARRRYAWGTLRLFRLSLVKNLDGEYRLNNFGMFNNHLKIALRTFWREKGFTAINLLGLSLGLCCTLLIALWVADEFAYDAFHEKGDRIYRVMRNETNQEDGIVTNRGTAYPIADALLEEIPEISQVVRVTGQDLDVKIGDDVVSANLGCADPELFDVFSFPLVEGSAESALSELQNVVISERLALDHFGEESPVGQTIELMNGQYGISFTVGGVMKDMPKRSSIQFDVIIPIEFLLRFNSTHDSWGNSWMATYALLEEGTAVDAVDEKIRDLPKRKADVEWYELWLQPYADMYLHSKFENGQPSGGRIDYVVLMVVIGAFTLLIACFNFVNLTTARSTKRTQEIGVRKVMGAGRGTLLQQFTIESTLLTLSSVVVGVVLAQVLLPYFNVLSFKELVIDYSSPQFYGMLGVITLATVLLSGVYPAVFLSSFEVINSLKGKIIKNHGSYTLGKALVVVQFSLSMILIAGALIVYNQLEFIQNKDLGLDKENILYVPLNSQSYKHREAFMAELGRLPGISAVSASNGNFIASMGSTSDPTWDGKPADAGNLWFAVMTVDFGLLEMLDMEVLEGRSFSKSFATDSVNYLINEEAAQVMAMDDPIGKDLSFWGNKGKIVGIAKNFHFRSLHNPITPMIVMCRPTESDLIYVKTQPGKTKEVLAEMSAVHEQFSTLPMEYHFLDDVLERGYEQEQRTQSIAAAFSGLSIFISCLGLLGLASFSAQQRVKEIAIRKVLGAKLSSLMQVLFRQYFVLILAGLVVGIPIVHYWSASWLDEFTYRIDVSWWVYLLPIALILLIASLTVSRISIKVAGSNPVDSLRNE